MEIINIREENFKDEKPKSKSSSFGLFLKIFLKFLSLGFLFSLLGAILIFYSVYRSIVAEFHRTKPKDNVTQTVFYDKNGDIIYESYGAKKPEEIKLSEVPDHLIKATLAAEDLEFYRHEAYDLKGIVRAVLRNLKNSDEKGFRKLKVLLDEKSYTEGGSTITQQLVKNRYLSSEKSFKRKLKEIIYAIELEKKYSKDEILEQYLSYIYYGEQSLGIKNAARTYFNKDVKDLTLSESSMLSGLPAAPTKYSPISGDFYESKKRQEYVLQRMYLAGFISLEEAKKAANEELFFANKKEFIVKYPYFVNWVKEEVDKNYGKGKSESGGFKIYTSLDPKVQELSENKAREYVAKFKNYNVSNAAVVVMDLNSNNVIAMVGGVDWEKSKVNVATALRQPGSSFKPLIYYTGLENGYTASSKLLDKYVNFGGNPPYIPRNYDGRYRGYVSVRDSLANSLNIPAVEMLSLVGLDKVIENGDKLGLNLGEDAKRCGLALALGCKEVRLIDLVNMYSVFAANGKMSPPSGIVKVLDQDDREITKKKEKEKVLDEDYSYIITNILSDEKARRKVFGWGNKLEIKRPAAAKTGTTDNYTDSWTLGYTPDYIVGVWMGNNDRKPMRVISGIEGAAYIWHDIMIELHRDLPIKGFERPQGIIEVKINPFTNEVAKTTLWGVTEVYKKGTEPKGKENLEYLNRFR